MNKFEALNLVSEVILCGGDAWDQDRYICKIKNAIEGFSDNPQILGYIRDAVDKKLVFTGFFDYSIWREDLFKMIDEKLEAPTFEALSLIDLFNHTSKYEKVMALLVDSKKISHETFDWIDQKNGYKSYLASLITALKQKGYFKESSPINSTQIQKVIKNTFRIKVSNSTIMHAEIIENEFDFIPLASAIE